MSQPKFPSEEHLDIRQSNDEELGDDFLLPLDSEDEMDSLEVLPSDDESVFVVSGGEHLVGPQTSIDEEDLSFTPVSPQSNMKGQFFSSQNPLLEKIVLYLSSKKNPDGTLARDQEFIDQFEDGYCVGLSSLWLYAISLSFAGERTDKPKNDYNWFQKTIDLLLDFEEGRDLEPKEEQDIENFISYIQLFQHPQLYLPVTQGDLAKPLELQENRSKKSTLLEDTNGRNPEQEYSIASLFAMEEFERLLSTPGFLKEKRLVLISSDDHAVALFIRDDGRFTFFDPNDFSNLFYPKTPNDIALAVFVANRVFDQRAYPLGIRIFHFGEKEHYPSQKELLSVCSFPVWPPSWMRTDSFIKQTGLMMAALIGCQESAEHFLSLPDTDLTARASGNDSALTYAVRGGNNEIVKMILLKIPDFLQKQEVGLQNTNGSSPLILAAQYGYDDIVDTLLSYNASLDLRDGMGMSAFMYAAKHGHAQMVRKFLVVGANYNYSNKEDKTALMLAKESGYPNVVNEMLMFAIGNGSIDLVKDCLIVIDDPNLPDKDGFTIIMRAVQSGHRGIVEAIISDKRVKINSQNREGQTALGLAVHEDHLDSANILKKHGANFGIADKAFSLIASGAGVIGGLALALVSTFATPFLVFTFVVGLAFTIAIPSVFFLLLPPKGIITNIMLRLKLKDWKKTRFDVLEEMPSKDYSQVFKVEKKIIPSPARHVVSRSDDSLTGKKRKEHIVPDSFVPQAQEVDIGARQEGTTKQLGSSREEPRKKANFFSKQS